MLALPCCSRVIGPGWLGRRFGARVFDDNCQSIAVQAPAYHPTRALSAILSGSGQNSRRSRGCRLERERVGFISPFRRGGTRRPSPPLRARRSPPRGARPTPFPAPFAVFPTVRRAGRGPGCSPAPASLSGAPAPKLAAFATQLASPLASFLERHAP